MMTISTMTSESLTTQIRKGQIWLRDHAQKTGTDLNEKGEKYNPSDFMEKLNMYEAMVNEYKARGFDELPIMKDEVLIENEKKR